MARSNIIKNFINSSMDISTALQNLMSILYCLDDKKLINWANKELSGYNENDELPEYRKLKGRVMASFIVGYVQYSKRTIWYRTFRRGYARKLIKYTYIF